MAVATQPTEITVRRLANGLTVVHEAMPWLPSVSLSLVLPFGSATDPVGAEGAATVLSEWLERGAGARDTRAFADAFDALGARRSNGSGRETTGLQLSLLAEALPEALSLLSDQLRRPALDDATFGPARDLALEELASLDDEPSQRLAVELIARYFASTHGRSPFGTAGGLAALDPGALRSDAAGRLGPRDAVLAVAGGIAWTDLEGLLADGFGDWSGGHVPLPVPEPAGPSRHHVEADSAQVQIGVAYPAVGPDESGWYPQAIAMQALSGGFGSRLFSEVREKRGLVYSVGARIRTVRGHGYASAYAGTTPERAGETYRVLLAELDRLREGLEADEFERARAALGSQLVMQGEASGSRAQALAHDTFLRGRPRGLAEIRAALAAVDLESVNGHLAERPALLPTTVTVGPAAVDG